MIEPWTARPQRIEPTTTRPSASRARGSSPCSVSTRLAFTAIPLDAGKLELGRDELSELGLDDSRVSRRHLGVQLRGSNWTIRDHGSTNGTCVDGRPLTGSETFAAPQVIRIGRTLLLPRAEIGDHALLGMQADAAAVVDPALRRVHEKIATIARASPNLMIHGAGEWNDWDGHDIGWYWGAAELRQSRDHRGGLLRILPRWRLHQRRGRLACAALVRSWPSMGQRVCVDASVSVCPSAIVDSAISSTRLRA